ncbi:MAG: nucleotidyltransferase domain-containing protein [Clostridia bacterium]
MDRCINKDFSQIPYPASKEEILQTIIRIDNEIKNNFIEKLWHENSLNILTINAFNDIKALPLSHYHFLHKIIDTLLKISGISEIVSFGSLARNQLTPLSDIDLCVITDLNVYEIKKMLETIKEITFIDTTLNKVTIRFNEILIEIVVCKKLEEIGKFYTNSMINDIKHSIIKGTENTFLTLQKMNKEFNFDKIRMKSETIKRLMFTFLSLNNIMKNGDDYRFYFNCNIIIHEVVKLYAFSKNKFAYSYLPKMATEDIDFEISSLVYDFKIDKKIYICRLAKSLIKVLTDVDCYEKKYIEILNNF